MATRTVRVDDFDGKSEDAESIYFSLNGDCYVIDLAAGNRKKLEDALKPFIEKAYGLDGKEMLKRVGGNGGGGDYDPQVVRSWLSNHGHHVNDKGRIPEAQVAIWRKATQK